MEQSRLTGQPVSPRDYQQNDIGWTELGLQVWCRRHQANIAHIDFQGAQHPACLTRVEPT
jgi:hypothetical protein